MRRFQNRERTAVAIDFRGISGGGGGADDVVIIHGWGVRSRYMLRLAGGISAAGYRVLNCGYSHWFHRIPDIAARFLAGLRSRGLPRPGTSFVVHSMGGLILRAAMAEMTESECRRIAAVVMLGTPNRGSGWAVLGVPVLSPSLLGMLPGAPDFRLPPYIPPTGVIAGRFDCKVSFSATALPDGWPFSRITVDCGHAGLVRPCRTLLPVLDFLKNKKF